MKYVSQHNHLTRGIMDIGECPACDQHHEAAMKRKWPEAIAKQVDKSPAFINDGRIVFEPGLILTMKCGACGYNLSGHDEYAGWCWDGAADAAHEFAEWTNHCPKCDARIDSHEDDEDA